MKSWMWARVIGETVPCMYQVSTEAVVWVTRVPAIHHLPPLTYQLSVQCNSACHHSTWKLQWVLMKTACNTIDQHTSRHSTHRRPLKLRSVQPVRLTKTRLYDTRLYEYSLNTMKNETNKSAFNTETNNKHMAICILQLIRNSCCIHGEVLFSKT